jgi:CheY-like chemotaxis protein
MISFQVERHSVSEQEGEMAQAEEAHGVLVVDDDPAFVKLAEVLLRRRGLAAAAATRTPLPPSSWTGSSAIKTASTRFRR